MKDYVSSEAERILLADDYHDLARDHSELALQLLELQERHALALGYVTQAIRRVSAAEQKAEQLQARVDSLTGLQAWRESAS